VLLLRKLAALAALSICATGLTAGGSTAAAVNALTADDAAAYASAFQSAAHGDFGAADQAASRVSDKSLLGYLQFQKLMWPAARTTYAELTEWLHTYADLPGADRILQLARKRRPRGAPLPRLPADAALADPVELKPASSAKGQAAREAYYSGDVETAYQLALSSGERWIAGLAAFRLRDYPAAMSKFQQVALDASESEWTRSAAAYWAARSAIAAGSPEFAPDFLRIAARTPTTFYGMIAERELGLDPAADPQAYILAQAGLAPTPQTGQGEFIRASYTALSGPALARLIKSDIRAKRAVALAQIGRASEAGMELRAGLASAGADAQRRRLWTTLAIQINGPVDGAPRRGGGFDPDDYPTPRLEPKGGFTLDKALVYALVRQESRFNPNAVSSAGAVGLMQLMPVAAARAAGDDKLLSDASPLYDPATNLRLGQDYLQLLMEQATHGDMIRAVAAYNGGPGSLLRTEQMVGDSDPLMLIESLPAGETRAYVQKVVAGYWIYRRMFGESGRTLDSVASGANVVDPRIDR
jgi:soluble lytic murein transglycosylase-like protein